MAVMKSIFLASFTARNDKKNFHLFLKFLPMAVSLEEDATSLSEVTAKDQYPIMSFRFGHRPEEKSDSHGLTQIVSFPFLVQL